MLNTNPDHGIVRYILYTITMINHEMAGAKERSLGKISTLKDFHLAGFALFSLFLSARAPSVCQECDTSGWCGHASPVAAESL